MPGLSEEQVALYRDNGYLVLENVLTREQLQGLRDEVAKVIENARAVSENDDVYDLEDSHTPARPRVRRIKLPHRHIPYVWELIKDARLTDPVVDLLGPDLRIHTSKLNMKAAGYGAAVEWHQDWAFYPHTNDDVLAVGIMLDDVGDDNGPLQVVPGSHRGQLFDHHHDGRFCGAIDPEAPGLGLDRAVPMTGPAGSISLHHARLVHGSSLNRSGRDRRLLLYEITAADAWPLAGTFSRLESLEEYDSRMVRGEPTIAARLAPVPVRIPLPKPLTEGSIYQNQKGSGRRFFEVHEEEPAAAS